MRHLCTKKNYSVVFAVKMCQSNRSIYDLFTLSISKYQFKCILIVYCVCVLLSVRTHNRFDVFYFYFHSTFAYNDCGPSFAIYSPFLFSMTTMFTTYVHRDSYYTLLVYTVTSDVLCTTTRALSSFISCTRHLCFCFSCNAAWFCKIIKTCVNSK